MRRAFTGSSIHKDEAECDRSTKATGRPGSSWPIQLDLSCSRAISRMVSRLSRSRLCYY